MARLGMPVSDTTILRSVKQSVGAQPDGTVVRVVGIDEWAWRKGTNIGTVIVDLERRQVVALLADRSAATTADWLKRHPDIEVVSRDRAGLYADAARQGAPQARKAHRSIVSRGPPCQASGRVANSTSPCPQARYSARCFSWAIFCCRSLVR
jgi:transposase